MKEQLHIKGPEGYQYETPVGQIEKPILQLATQLRDKFEAGQYPLIIGDDISGRFPTLVLARLARHLALRQHLPLTVVNYISRHADPDIKEMQERELREAIEAQGISSALVVTEYINEGTTISSIQRLAREIGVTTDVASLEHTTHPFVSGTLFSGRADGVRHNMAVIELRSYTRRCIQSESEYRVALRDVRKLADRTLLALGLN